MRHAASKQLQKKRKAEAMSGESESKASRDEASHEEAGKKDASKDSNITKPLAASPEKKQRHGMFSAKKFERVVEDEDSSEDNDGGVNKIASGTKKVTKLLGDPFTAVRNNLLAQNTTSSRTQHTATPTPASKIARLSSKQTTLIFDMSPTLPAHNEEAPHKPSDLPKRPTAPAKMADVNPKSITGGAGAAQAVANNKEQGPESRERSSEEMRKGAKDAKQALAHVQDGTMLTGAVALETCSSPTRKSIFGPTVRAEDEIVEGIEERDARQEKLKSESTEAMSFYNLPVAPDSQDSATNIIRHPPADLLADSAAKSAADTLAMAIAAEALKVNLTAAGAQASDSEDTITLRPVMPANPAVKDESPNKVVFNEVKAAAPKGSLSRRSGAANAGKDNNRKGNPLSSQKGGPKKSETPNTKTETVQLAVDKHSSNNAKPVTPDSKAGLPVVGKLAGGKDVNIESPARLAKNADGSLARGPKAAGTSATKPSVSSKEAKSVLTASPKPTAASTVPAPAAAMATPGASTSTDTKNQAAPVTGGITITPQGAPQAVMQSVPKSPAPPDQTIIFVINVDSPTNPETSTQLYHPFTLSTPFPLFSATVLEELGQDEKLVFASASKGLLTYPGMAPARFPVAMPAVRMIWANIMKKLAGVVGSGDETGEVVTVTFSQ